MLSLKPETDPGTESGAACRAFRTDGNVVIILNFKSHKVNYVKSNYVYESIC